MARSSKGAFQNFLRLADALETMEVPLPLGVNVEDITGIQYYHEIMKVAMVFLRVKGTGALAGQTLVYRSRLTANGWTTPVLEQQ